MKSTTFALVVLRKLSDISEDLPMRFRQQDFSCGMELQNERKFFDLKTEYSTVHHASDEDEMSDVPGVTGANEDGYSSDISNASTMLQDKLQWRENRKSRKTRQVLNSNRSSIIVDYASDTDVPILEKQQRKRKVKINRLSKQPASDSKEVLTTKNVEEKSQKRRSWTDSGVSLSLSRTDQSRCGTFENGITTKAHKNKDNENQSKTTKNFLKPDEGVNDNREDANENRSVPLRRRSSCGSRIECKRMNRLSQITNRSSLTNVTILTANSMSSLSSMITPSEMEYITSDNSVDEENDVTYDSPHNTAPRETEIVKASQDSFASSSTVVNSIANSRTSIETTVSVDLSNEERDNNYNHRNSSTPVKDTRPKQLSAKPNSTDATRKRSKSLLSGFKRVKQHLRPRFLSEKSYKDVSSDFSFEKARNNSETEHLFEAITADVLRKLEKLQEEESTKLEDISSTFIEYDSIDEDEESDNDILQKLSSPPVKEKGFFLGKIFKRSKSYSTSSIEKKNKKHLSTFNRASASRASIRSNPEHIISNTNEHVYFEETCEYPCDGSCCECDQDIPRARSMNCISEEIPYLKERSNSTPNTPLVMRNVQGLNSIENQCSCNECLYADYLDFLEFQQFRRYANYTPYAYTGSHEALTSHGSRRDTLLSIGENEGENIVAPLTVTIETDKEAKTFRTSRYESFV